MAGKKSCPFAKIGKAVNGDCPKFVGVLMVLAFDHAALTGVERPAGKWQGLCGVCTVADAACLIRVTG